MELYSAKTSPSNEMYLLVNGKENLADFIRVNGDKYIELKYVARTSGTGSEQLLDLRDYPKIDV